MAYPSAIYPESDSVLVESSRFIPKEIIINKPDTYQVDKESDNDVLDSSVLPIFTNDQVIICKFIRDNYNASQNSDIPGIMLSEFYRDIQKHYGQATMTNSLRATIRKTLEDRLLLKIKHRGNGRCIMGLFRNEGS
jgi:hypothetical protein